MRRVFNPAHYMMCLDSYYLAKELYPRLTEGHGLRSVGYRLGINGGHNRRYHTALADVEATRLLLHESICGLHLKTFGDLIRTVKVKEM
jgi:DNA polymerase III epsilon subunit-like protein